MTTRGIRDNDPGNIRRSSTEWLGLTKVQTDPSYCTFVDAPHGIRAIAKIMLSYQDAHGLRTVADIIGRWAPPNENQTAAYVERVARDLAVLPHDEIDVHDPHTMQGLVTSIVAHENENYVYPTDVVLQGLTLAGIATATT